MRYINNEIIHKTLQKGRQLVNLIIEVVSFVGSIQFFLYSAIFAENLWLVELVAGILKKEKLFVDFFAFLVALLYFR